MATEIIELPEKPRVFEEVYCPHQECGQNITSKFNSMCLSLFLTKRKEYLERKQKVENPKGRKQPAGALELITKYEQGKLEDSFIVFCSECKQRLNFLMYNTFTGDTRMKDGTPIPIVRPNPNKKASDFA